ncbi:flocculation protein FLO11-like [Dendronephthya gigantea]|uniref:flocculation protein FLO11-like n=1 Tax=Dendronephthya gigantea TaxID=151771 RepID=UPI0010690565|nr:flocculation protein FLO11-like [Dendronephthya gigantea]
MELSKLSINLLAKEKIRRRFFNNCSAKSKASDELDSSDNKLHTDSETSKEEEAYKVEQEIDVIDVPRFDEEAYPNEDNSLPLITSVFSLASNSGKEDEGCGSGDKVFLHGDQMENVEGTSPRLPCISSSQDVLRCNQDNLPFVVKCSPSGVITVCSSPNLISNSNFNVDKDSSSLAPSVKGSFSRTESQGIASSRADQQLLDGVTAGSLSGTFSNPNVVTFIDATRQIVTPAEQPCIPTGKSERTSEGSTRNPTSGPRTDVPSNIQRIDEVTDDSGTLSILESNETEEDKDNGARPSSSLSDTLSDKAAIKESSAEEVYIGQQVPTKQEERIRQLKDLLRQKEVELEKFRFKGKAGQVSAAAKLRANFLKKNPSLCRRSLRLSTKEGSESGGTFSREAVGDNEIGLDRNDLTSAESITCQSETKLTDEKMSGKSDCNDSNTSKKSCDKFNDQDKYKLVNVTVLQGHIRTLAVPLHEKAVSQKTDSQNSLSLFSKENITTTRKRKQQMPRKVGPRRSKRKSNSEEVRFDQARSSLNRKEGNQSPKSILKRKSCNNIGTQDGPSAPKREQRKTFPALKQGTSVSSSGTPVSSLALPTTRAESQTQIGSLLTPTTMPALSNLNGSVSSKNAPEIKNVKSTTHVRITSVYSPTTVTQDPITSSKQQTRTSTTRKNVACVFDMNGSGQSSQEGNSSVSLAPDLLKRVAENISNGQLPEDKTGCEGDFKVNNFSAASHVTLTKAQSNLEPVTTQNTGKPTVIPPKVASKITVCPTSTKHLPDASGKGQASTISIPLVNLEHSKIPNELAKLGLTCGNNVSSQSKSPLPHVSNVDIEIANKDTACKPIQLVSTFVQSKQVDLVMSNDTAIINRQSSQPFVDTTTEQLKTVTQSTCVSNSDILCKTAPRSLTMPVNELITNSQAATSVTSSVVATTMNCQVKTTLKQALTTHSFRPQASVAAKNQISTGVTALNVPADSTSGVANSMNSLSPTIERKEAALKTEYPVPNSLYTLNTLTVPVARAAGESKAKNVYVAPIKDNANVVSRPLAPKPTPPQFISHRPIAPKPTPIHHSPPATVMFKPTAHLNNITVPLLSKTVSSVSASSEHHTSAKSKSPQSISTKPNTAKSTPSQGTATNSTSSEQKINILPKPIMSVPTSSSPAFSENIKNGKILVYDVVKSNIAQSGGNPPIVSQDGAKLVVYVSNTGEKRNLGIIKDQKIYLNSNQVAAVTNRPKVQSPVTTSPAEFIPNANDAEFNVLLGLEHVVKLLL